MKVNTWLTFNLPPNFLQLAMCSNIVHKSQQGHRNLHRLAFKLEPVQSQCKSTKVQFNSIHFNSISLLQCLTYSIYTYIYTSQCKTHHNLNASYGLMFPFGQGVAQQHWTFCKNVLLSTIKIISRARTVTLVYVGVFFRQEKLEKMAEKFERKVCHCVQRRNPTAVAHRLRFTLMSHCCPH